MRIYYDTEFTSLDGNVDWDMVSAGFVAEDGRELYIEISDFLRETCSEFVVETVLPLLGKGDVLPQRIPGSHFAWRLCNWLDTIEASEINLISDSSCDWWIVQAYAMSELSTYPRKVRGQVWQRSDSPIVNLRLAAAESDFWSQPGNKDMIHHALYDARRLKLLAEKQRSYIQFQ